MKRFPEGVRPRATGGIGTQRRRLLKSALSAAVPAAASLGMAATAVSGSYARAAGPVAGAGACPSLLDHVFPRLQDDSPLSLCQFSGKVLLVVNTASECGFTPQYEGLERLHRRFAGRGLVILGFPSNDFGGQEPGNSRQIGEVCFNTYGVGFPMLARSSVIGPGANPFHAQLARLTGHSPKWNFHKYLIDRSGQPVASYPSRVTPESRELVAAIEHALGTG